MKYKILIMLISINRHLIALPKERGRDFVVLECLLLTEKQESLRTVIYLSLHTHARSPYSAHALFFPRCLLLLYFSLLIKKFKLPEDYWFVIECLACFSVMIIKPGPQSALSVIPYLLTLASWSLQTLRDSLDENVHQNTKNRLKPSTSSHKSLIPLL